MNKRAPIDLPRIKVMPMKILIIKDEILCFLSNQHGKTYWLEKRGSDKKLKKLLNE